ncbi:MAG: hypothetical protein KGQ49_05905, partial [Verrucomicrobia bacterium]|nr:hypothetical protein [Verrucomicrobiota bacterium]
MIRIFLFSLICVTFVSCALVDSSFRSEIVFTKEPKNEYTEVEFLTRQPSRVALRIGSISSSGNGYADFDDLVIDAKKKAARIGGDFIIQEDAGIDKSTVWIPGSSTYDSSANVSWGSSHGYGSSTAKGRSTGPSMINIAKPWSVFSVWVYASAQTGLRLNEHNGIESFHLNSDAPRAGIKVGDQVIGIDGLDVADERVIHHLMSVRPGDK